MTLQPLLLPNEIVDQILDCALTIPEETFRAWRTPHTFAGTPHLHPYRVLATSWQWYRVGAPYLYEAAILRTKEQVHDFCEAICKYHRGEKLSRYLRRLRVDGGYSPELGQIMKMAGPQLTELFLCFDISIDDNFKGLLRSLEQVNPSRLLLDASLAMRHDVPVARMDALSTAISHTVPSWSKLRRIDISPGFSLPNDLLEYLLELPQVEYVSSDIKVDSNEFTLEWLDEVLRPILERPALKMLQFRNGKAWLLRGLSTWGAALHGVRHKLILGEGKNMVPLADFPDMSVIVPEPTSLPELPDKIWARIIWIATHYDGYDPAVDSYEMTVWANNADRRVALNTRLQILRVCKRFHRIGREHLYSHPFLFREKTEPFLLHLQRNPDLASLVRVLHVDPGYMDHHDARFKHISAPFLNLVRVNSGIQVFPGLLKYAEEGSLLPLESLEQCIASPDMRKQHLAPTDMITPSMFLKLPHLRRVVLAGGRAGRLGEVVVDLPHLECLHLYEPGVDLTKLFRDMNLPHLREFGFKPTSQAAVTVLDFLKVHGAKLDVLTINLESYDEDFKQPLFDHCPNVTELRLETTGWVPSLIPFLAKSKPHPCIERITLPRAGLGRQYGTGIVLGDPDGGIGILDPLEPWVEFVQFLSKHRDKFPVLTELRVLGDFAWPVNQWQYRKSDVWVATSVALALHKTSIALADKTGTRWCRFDLNNT
ncbi:hypothetical protein L226DRAFT_115348 [Lentinus tigrinus ALCF2SS1-7]|uniref:Uncharacterized protein n=1 Tax=Lentinus tigrinus ALCF2SS1-6 TaxID=1328759 RepID=A0A5C2STH5_9APHY|nr:hypothetical protein L227DRAFT_488 [Lentinus tigrinus ALCF2SS1-6]RPD80619.1 hypothetical protein L226DRAFT_115348 [Lentinus tigrinus ALCF2SS1-7]